MTGASTELFRSKNINSRGAAACTQSIFISGAARKVTTCLHLLGLYLLLHRYPSFSSSLLPHSWQVAEGKSHEAKAICALFQHIPPELLGCDSRDGVLLTGSMFLPFPAAGSRFTSSAAYRRVLPRPGYQTGSPSTGDCIFPAATWCTFCVWKQSLKIAQDQIFHS